MITNRKHMRNKLLFISNVYIVPQTTLNKLFAECKFKNSRDQSNVQCDLGIGAFAIC